jgi:putative ABC transport system ATP-binding protein
MDVPRTEFMQTRRKRRVERIVLEPGRAVQPDSVIVVLGNPELERVVQEAEWASSSPTFRSGVHPMSYASDRDDASVPLIRMRAITKVFYTDEIETHALSGVHCDIRRGEFVSVSGPSGCGKSTLLAILGLLDTPSSGEYLLNGRPVEEIGVDERATLRNREIGFIFQSFNLIGDLTVYQNVELPLTYRNGLSREVRKKAVMEALDRVGMAHRVSHFPSQLSGGQQQRVAVARALGGSPSILLADEPTGNLDSKNGEAVMDLLRRLHVEGATICMVTHDTRYADFAERRVQLFDGRILFEDRMRPVVTHELATAV